MRRRILGLLDVVAVLTVVTLVPTAGQDLTTARQEGKVVIVGSSTRALRDSLKRAFEAKYPQVSIEWVTGRVPAETVRKFLDEYEKGAQSADVITLGQAALFDILQKPHSLAAYVPKDTGWLAADLKDKDGRWASSSTSLYGIGYNTKLVSQAEAPKSYQDLLDPKWKGKLGAWDPKLAPAIPAMWKTMEKHLGEDFIRRLAEQKIIYYGQEGWNKFVAGEVSIFLNIRLSPVESRKHAGDPLDWVRTTDNTYFSQPLWVGLSANAPHPHAARVFMDFIFSQEGQQLLADDGQIPTRPGLQLANPDLDLQGKKLIAYEHVTDAEREAFFKSFSAKYNLAFP